MFNNVGVGQSGTLVDVIMTYFIRRCEATESRMSYRAAPLVAGSKGQGPRGWGRATVSASAAGEEAYQEDFNWSSVILPFVFPALGGLLFGYDIGATSGATLSLQSAELSGTTWFNLSAVQLGLV
ncbi:hypothetical protein Tco_0760168, partial [Tanacetum coccineum]